MGKAYDGTRISSYNYAYYLDGNIKSENNRTFTYDNLGRLKQEQNGTDTISYTYDRFGNRVSMTKNEAVITYGYDLNNRLISEVDYETMSVTQYAYDNRGNLYSKQTRQDIFSDNTTIPTDFFGLLKDHASSTVELYSYDGLNRMTEARKGGVTAQYTYNAEGIRTSKTVNGVTTDFLLDGSNVTAETKNNTTTSYIRGVSGIISSEIVGTNNTTKYYTSDAHGNITNLTDSTGVVVKTYTYDAFGVEQNIDSNDTNPFRYCGEYYDSEINQIYLRARYYNPTLGRFTQSDPAMSGINWYVYCGNDPVNMVDFLGLEENGVSVFAEEYDAERIEDNSEEGYTLFYMNGVYKKIYWDPKKNNEVYKIGSSIENGSLRMERLVFLNIFEVSCYHPSVNYYTISPDEAGNRLLMVNVSIGSVIQIGAGEFLSYKDFSPMLQVTSGVGTLIFDNLSFQISAESGNFRQELFAAEIWDSKAQMFITYTVEVIMNLDTGETMSTLSSYPTHLLPKRET